MTTPRHSASGASTAASRGGKGGRDSDASEWAKAIGNGSMVLDRAGGGGNAYPADRKIRLKDAALVFIVLNLCGMQK